MYELECPIPILVKWTCSACGTSNERKSVYTAKEKVQTERLTTEAGRLDAARELSLKAAIKFDRYQKTNQFKYEGHNMRCWYCGHKEYWARIRYVRVPLWKALLILFIGLPIAATCILAFLVWFLEEILLIEPDLNLVPIVFMAVYLISFSVLFVRALLNRSLLKKVDETEEENLPHVCINDDKRK